MTGMKRALRGAAIATVAALLPAAAQADDEVSFILNWVTAGAHAPLYYAQKEGWFAEAGLEVSLEQGKGSTLSAQKVGSGASDMGIADLGTAMVAKGAGADLVAVMNIFANSPYRMYWLKSSGITDLPDFAGRKFGNPPADAARAMWPALAKANGMDPDDLKWVNIAPNAKVSALKSGAVDGTTFFANYHYIMEGAFGDDLQWFAWSDRGVNPYSNSIIVNGAFLEENPEVVSRFVEVAQKAYRYCVDHGEACVAVLPEFSSGVKPEREINNWNAVVELMTDETSTTKGLGYFEPARMEADYELVTTYFNVKTPYDVTSVYTNEFLDPAIVMPK
ncbi:MAG: ABC transporter substrate-binding protein [Rhodospirillales bacterium]